MRIVDPAGFCDRQIPVLSTLGRGPKGEKGDVGDSVYPTFADDPWSIDTAYKKLTVVLYEGNSYTAKQDVPAGIDITNTDFWAETGNYDEQVEQVIETMRSYDFVTPEQFGAVPDGVTDCTNAIQDAIDSGKVVLFNAKTYVITSPLLVNSPTTLIANKGSKLLCDSCDCLVVSAGKVSVIGLYVECMENDNNTFITIGSSDHATYGIELSYVHASKFSNAIVEYRCWQLNINNCYFTVLDGYGIHAIDKSVNNTVDNSQFVCNEVGNADTGIFFDAQFDVSEGWMITNCLVYGFRIGIKAIQTSHVELANNIIDFCAEKGIELNSVSTNNSLGWIVNGNYIAGGADLTHGIHDNNQSVMTTQAFQSSNIYVNNKILKYQPNTSVNDFGIMLEQGANSSIVSNNTIRRFTRGIKSLDDLNRTIITDNACLSVGSKSCSIEAQGCIVANNQASYSSNLFISKIGSMQIISPINTTATPLASVLDIANVGDIVNYRTTTKTNVSLYRVTNEDGTKQLTPIMRYLRNGSIAWLASDSPDYLDVVYDTPFNETHSDINITPLCTQKITYTLSDISRFGFRINIWDKPSANATFIWKVLQ